MSVEAYLSEVEAREKAATPMYSEADNSRVSTPIYPGSVAYKFHIAIRTDIPRLVAMVRKAKEALETIATTARLKSASVDTCHKQAVGIGAKATDTIAALDALAKGSTT